MTPPLRLTVVMTHPVQYFAPWFRWMANRRPEIDLTVLYGAIPTPEQQGTGYGRPFEWDVPVTDGYRYVVCADAAGKRFGDHDPFGIDVPDIGQRIADSRPDVVLIPGWHAAMQRRALRECRRRDLPVLYRGDSTLNSAPRRILRPAWRLKTRLMLRQFEGFLSVGTMPGEYLIAFGVPEPMIASSPHCVDNDRFGAEADQLRADGARERLRAEAGASDDDLVVLFAGRFIPRKRPLDAVRAVAALRKQDPGSGERLAPVLMMAGDGPLAADARAEAARLGVRLSWLGFQNQSEMPAAFVAADCLLVPSTFETWGLVVNEALACGLPCVTTREVAASRDLIVEGSTGYTVSVGAVDDMAARLDEIRDARAKGHDFAPACRARVAASNFDAATDGLVAISHRVLTRRQLGVENGFPVRTGRSLALPGDSTAGPLPDGAVDAGHCRPVACRIVECCGHMVSVFGLERMTFEALSVLRAHGAPVHCIVNGWSSSRIVAMAEGIGASWSTGFYRYDIKRRGWTAVEILKMAWDIFLTSAGLLRDARRMRATHVIVPDYLTALRNAPALLALRLIGVRVVARLGNAPEDGTFYRRLWRWGVNPLVSTFVTNSQYTSKVLLSTGVPERKTRMIYNALPTRKPRSTAVIVRDYARIVYVGQMIPPKGVDVLLAAVGELVRRGHEVTLDLIGDIDGWESKPWEGYRQRLRERADRPDLRGRVRFLGIQEDVDGHMMAAGIHCCPSQPEQREAFGIVNLEAKHAGIPSVVTPYGALPELIEHRKDGWICRDGSADAVAEGLEYFLTDRTRLLEASLAARRSFAQFDRDHYVMSLLTVFGLAHLTAVRENDRSILVQSDVH